MRTLLTIALLLSSLIAAATDYDALWRTVSEAERRDMPRQTIAAIDRVIAAARKDRDYGELLAARIARIRAIGEISADSIPGALAALSREAQATEREASASEREASASREAAALAAVSYTVLARWAGEDGAVPSADSCYALALARPDILASFKTQAYRRLITPGQDDAALYAGDLLSFIGHEAGRYRFLRDYYLAHGRRRAAAAELYLEATQGGKTKGDRALTESRRLLREGLEEYADTPEGALLAQAYYASLRADEDISDAHRHDFLTTAIEHYRPICARSDRQGYVNALQNALAELTRPRFSLSIGGDIELNDIRNVQTVTVALQRLNADGTLSLDPSRRAERQRLQRMAVGEPLTQSRQYHNAEWETHADTLRLAALQPGVYLVTAKADTLTAYTLYYNTGLAVLSLPQGKKSVRIVVVNKLTGEAVPHANVDLSTNNRWDKTRSRAVRLVTNSRGEATFDNAFAANQIRVWTEADNAFRPTYFSAYFSQDNRIESRTLLTVLTDRAIYRPTQEVQGVVIAHRAPAEDAMRPVAEKRLRLRFDDADGKTIRRDTLTTDSLGHAPFRFTLPKDGMKLGRCLVWCEGDSSITATAAFRVEEYRRPTFEVEALQKEQYCKPVCIDKNAADSTITVQFRAKSFAAVPVQGAEVTYTVKRRQLWWRYGRGTERTLVAAAKAVTDSLGIVSVPLTLALPDEARGSYLFSVALSVTDRSGETHETTLRVTASVAGNQSLADDKAPLPLKEFELSDTRFPYDTKTVTLTLRDTVRAAHHVYYSLLAGDRVVESGTCRFDTLLTRRLSYKAEYGEALTVAYAWLLNGRQHTFVKTIGRPMQDTRLQPKWQTFRDRTQPGASERWTLNLGTPNAVAAVTLYDKSLDTLLPHQWAFRATASYYHLYTSWQCHTPGAAYADADTNIKMLAERGLSVASLSSMALPVRRYFADNLLMSRGPVRLMAKSANAAMGVAKPEEMEEKSTVADGTIADGEQETAAEDLSTLVRADFGETAYFSPSLHADAKGNATMEFTLPETLTTWRLMAFAHDQRMHNAIITRECVAAKDITVKPNVPRFLRQGDTATLAATVQNVTDQATTAHVTMQYLAARNDSVVWQHAETVQLAASQTADVAFAAPTITTADSMLVFRIAAVAEDGAADGEQHIIPILAPVERVTETAAFTLHGTAAFSQDLSALLVSGSTSRKLTIRYTPRAEQMILDAIPAAVSPKNDDAFSLATAVYVGRLFAIPDTANVCQRLTDTQLADGSWPWWKGMRGSVWTTAAVSRLLARLVLLGHNSAATDRMLSRSMPVLLKAVSKEAEDIRRYRRKYPKQAVRPSETAADILYTIALARKSQTIKTISRNEAKDVDYLITLLAEVPCELSIYGKAHTATTLALYGRKAKAREHLRSLLEYSVVTEEAGRYFDTPRAQYSWRNYRIPSAVAAIEALHIVEPQDTVTVEQLQRWLLHERRTQEWDNSLNTADAITAFITTAPPIPPMGGEMAEDTSYHIFINGNPISVEGGKYTLPFDTIYSAATPLGGQGGLHFTAEKRGQGTAWGSVAVEQDAPIAVVKSSGTGFRIRREVLGQTGGKLGERVTVRITIDADRDYDCVSVTDRRAACHEPVEQLSGYRAALSTGTARGSYSGYYRVTRDTSTTFYFDRLAKGRHIIDTDYYIDRHGTYQPGTATVRCEYAPEFGAITK